MVAKTAGNKMAPVPPGEILLEDFLKPLGITQYRLAKDIRVDPRRIHAIVKGERAVSTDTALRLAHYFGTSARFWLNGQMRYELEKAEQEQEEQIKREVTPFKQT